MTALTIYENKEQVEIAQKTLQDLSERSSHIRRMKTAPKSVKLREGKKGRTFKYVTGIYVQRWLDKFYPGWYFKVNASTLRVFGGFVSIEATLYIPCPELGIIREFTSIGTHEVILAKDTKEEVIFEYGKSAETDALKRCAFRLGCATDVYTNESEEIIESNLDENDSELLFDNIGNFINLFSEIKETKQEAFEAFRIFIKAIGEGKLSPSDAMETLNNYLNSKKG